MGGQAEVGDARAADRRVTDVGGHAWRRRAAWMLVAAAIVAATGCSSSGSSTTEQIEAAWDRYLQLSTELLDEDPSDAALAVDEYSHGDATDALVLEAGFMSMLGLHIPSTRTSEDVVVTIVDDATATIEPCVVTDMGAFEINGRRSEAEVTSERVRVRLELLDGERWSVAEVEHGRGDC